MSSHEPSQEAVPWRNATWRQRAWILIEWAIAITIALLLAGFALYVVGSAIEGFSTRIEQTERCKSNAKTPGEYHRC